MRALLQGAAMVLFLLAGRVWPRVRGVHLINRDLVFNLANGALIFLVLGLPLGLVTAHVEIGLVPMDWLTWGPAQLLVAFVALDLSRYWLHRAGHRVPLLWRFHRVHHSAEYLDSTTGLRMHAVDFLQLWAVPFLLFGVLFDTSTFATWVVPTAFGVGVVMDSFQHANLTFDLNKPWNRAWHRLLNNPHFHAWHHTRDGALCDGNYGNTLVIWDRLFGTEVTRPVLPALYGLEDDQALENDVVGWQLLRSRRAVTDAAARSNQAPA
jgi:sterol desaturase/sphingolipid hydroxylase (fatty acid hydroxylase superfamily)